MEYNIISIPGLTKEEVQSAINSTKIQESKDLCFEIKTKGICTHEYKTKTKCPASHTITELESPDL